MSIASLHTIDSSIQNTISDSSSAYKGISFYEKFERFDKSSEMDVY